MRFDEQTISSHRGMAPLTPNRRSVALVDGQGRRYPGSADGLTSLLIGHENSVFHGKTTFRVS